MTQLEQLAAELQYAANGDIEVQLAIDDLVYNALHPNEKRAASTNNQGVEEQLALVAEQWGMEQTCLAAQQILEQHRKTLR